MDHQGPRLFITGIPTSGKSHLAKALANRTGGVAVALDSLRESLANDNRYARWVDFYLEQDEKSYLTRTSHDDQWKDLVAQSEHLWPAFKAEIDRYAAEKRPVIFECVNLLPSIVTKDFNFPGVVLIGSSFEETFGRNNSNPRWGNTPELQGLEAQMFFEIERPRYATEARTHGWQIHEKADEALPSCLKLLNR